MTFGRTVFPQNTVGDRRIAQVDASNSSPPDFGPVVDDSAIGDREIRQGPPAIYSAAEVGRYIFADKAVADYSGRGMERDAAAGRAVVADYGAIADCGVGGAGAENSAAVLGIVLDYGAFGNGGASIGMDTAAGYGGIFADETAGNVRVAVQGVDAAALYGGWFRGLRGGSFGNSGYDLSSSSQDGFYPTYELSGVGFRVASVPEPCSLVLLSLGGLMLRRRRVR